MFTASEKRKTNIAEYLLYMWQIEDLIRANNLDIEQIKKNIIDHYTTLSPDERNRLTQWYESMIEMMRNEGVQAKGHLQINRNTLSDLSTLHQKLLADSRFSDYSEQFYKTLPSIVELRARSGQEKPGEIESCFNALYGLLVLRLQKKELTPQTQEALGNISRLIALLAHYYKLDEQGELFEE